MSSNEAVIDSRRRRSVKCKRLYSSSKSRTPQSETPQAESGGESSGRRKSIRITENEDGEYEATAGEGAAESRGTPRDTEIFLEPPSDDDQVEDKGHIENRRIAPPSRKDSLQVPVDRNRADPAESLIRPNFIERVSDEQIERWYAAEQWKSVQQMRSSRRRSKTSDRDDEVAPASSSAANSKFPRAS